MLRFEPGQRDNAYVHDYALLLDATGDDRYFNNAAVEARVEQADGRPRVVPLWV